MRELPIETIEQYQLELDKKINFDPLKWAVPQARDQVLLFTSDNDVIVPSNTQEALWQAWGKPKNYRLSTNHQFTIARVYFFWADEIDEFLKGL